MDGHPPIGWYNAVAYLIMPALLVASQYASMKIISPPQNKDDPSQAQSQAILQFLPLMIGERNVLVYFFKYRMSMTIKQELATLSH